MVLPFVKLHGLGNDFIFFEDLDDKLQLSEDQVRKLCDRHKGIGADGVIVVKPSSKPRCTAYMHYYNADGSLAQMCGNGVRCFSKYLVDRDIVDPQSGSFVADTLAGSRSITFTVDGNNKLQEATVAMGQPIFDPQSIPVNTEADALTPLNTPYVDHLKIDSPWGSFIFTCLSMGNPHAVCFIEDWNTLPQEIFSGGGKRDLSSLAVSLIGSYFESHPLFPEHTNVEFATIDGEDIAMRVFERGCGETLACGTGACATTVAAILRDLPGSTHRVRLLGGDLIVSWTEGEEVLMTGIAEESFSGSVELS